MTTMKEHTVREFSKELDHLKNMIISMANLVDSQIKDAEKALFSLDTDLSKNIVKKDTEIDNLEKEIDSYCVKLLALRQPMASDLRMIVASMRICHNLERIGDYSRNIAKRIPILKNEQYFKSPKLFSQLSVSVSEMLKSVIDSFISDDIDTANKIYISDEPIDEMYNSIFRELLTYMIENPRNITTAIHLLFIAKNLERIGDQSTSIAQIVHYSITGKNIDFERPKSSSI